MRRIDWAMHTAAAVLLGLVWVLPPAAGPAGAAENLSYAPGEVLVKFKPAAAEAAAAGDGDRFGMHTLRTFEAQHLWHVKVPSDMTLAEALRLYRQDPDVEYAEPNYYRHLKGAPNDTSFSSLWGLAKIQAPAAWGDAADCSAVVVALIDSGVDISHPDLAANIWSNPAEAAGNGLDDDGNGRVDDVNGWDFVCDDPQPIDANGHGTHVAGIIGAVGNNAEGVTGVCWQARIMALRAFDASGTGTVADIVAAMDYARRNGAKLINASYASSYPSNAEREALEQLRGAGILLIAAAGNELVDNDQSPSYPASYDLSNVIAVAATDGSDSLAAFSNYGATSVDVAAPGVGIYSTYLGAPSEVVAEEFEAGAAGWTLDVPIGRTEEGHDSGWSLTDSPGGDYANSADVSARSPELNMNGKSGALLEFYLTGRMRLYDKLYVETATSPGGDWTSRTVWLYDVAKMQWDVFSNGVSGDFQHSWNLAQVDLEGLDLQPSAYLRFRFTTNGSDVADGFYLDDVTVTAFATGQHAYTTESGTSMATPYVTGLAALIWSTHPELTAAQVKGRILDCVDRRPFQQERTVFTHGRINAYNSLNNIPASPSNFTVLPVGATQVDLSWDDNYSAAVGIKIERRDGPGSPFVEIADLPPGASGYQDIVPSGSLTYAYRARATTAENASGYTGELNMIASQFSEGVGGAGGGGGGCFISTLRGE
jgi:subtilisin family serine protease